MITTLLWKAPFRMKKEPLAALENREAYEEEMFSCRELVWNHKILAGPRGFCSA